MKRNLLWFVGGAVLTALAFYLILMPQLKGLQKTDNDAFVAQQARNSQAAAQLQAITQERDACTAKFSRETVLYDPSEVLRIPQRTWIIPADVTPQYVGSRSNAQFSHYNPKTQDETVKQPAP
jgi:hypothetical protein